MDGERRPVTDAIGWTLGTRLRLWAAWCVVRLACGEGKQRWLSFMTSSKAQNFNIDHAPHSNFTYYKSSNKRYEN